MITGIPEKWMGNCLDLQKLSTGINTILLVLMMESSLMIRKINILFFLKLPLAMC